VVDLVTPPAVYSLLHDYRSTWESDRGQVAGNWVTDLAEQADPIDDALEIPDIRWLVTPLEDEALTIGGACEMCTDFPARCLTLEDQTQIRLVAELLEALDGGHGLIVSCVVHTPRCAGRGRFHWRRRDIWVAMTAR